MDQHPGWSSSRGERFLLRGRQEIATFWLFTFPGAAYVCTPRLRDAGNRVVEQSVTDATLVFVKEALQLP